MTSVELPSLVAATSCAFVALLFARAAWHKLADFTAFTGFVADYAIVPASLVQPASKLIVAVEVLIVLGVMVPVVHLLAIGLAVTMLLVYAVAIAINVERGHDRIECGCGGAVQPLSWNLVARNGALAALASLGLVGPPFALSAAEALAAVMGGFTLFLGFIAIEQLLANASQARMRR